MWTILFILVLLIIYFVWENITLEKTEYEISIPHRHPDLKGTKIAHISDLHLPSQRVNLKAMVKEIKKEEPDVIVITGDIFQASTADRDTLNMVRYLGQSLDAIAPTYAVSGNHDMGLLDDDYWRMTLRNNKIHALEDESHWLPIGESGIHFLGLRETEEMSDYSVVPENRTFMEYLSITEEMKSETVVLLAHHPEYFEQYLLVENGSAIDLVLSGHTHGGQVRLPYIGGLFSPGQGMFPKYDYGFFSSEKNPGQRLIINRGMMYPTYIFRVNNRPEIGFITLK